jgi:hypothetical protein
MENETRDAPPPARSSLPAPEKQPWVAPRVAFVEPRLTKHGELTKVTGAFFGAFSPGAED